MGQRSPYNRKCLGAAVDDLVRRDDPLKQRLSAAILSCHQVLRANLFPGDVQAQIRKLRERLLKDGNYEASINAMSVEEASIIAGEILSLHEYMLSLTQAHDEPFDDEDEGPGEPL
jgi:hypothetical protein